MARGAFVRVRVRGLKRLKKELEGVPEKLRRKALRAGQTKASRIIITEARNRVPVRFGLLKKSLGRKSKTYRKTGTVVSVIGPRKGFRTERVGQANIYDDPVKYAHLVEYGTSHSSPKPFLRPAWDHNKGRILREQVEAIRRVLAKG